jgi:hypothetical protein
MVIYQYFCLWGFLKSWGGQLVSSKFEVRRVRNSSLLYPLWWRYHLGKITNRFIYKTQIQNWNKTYASCWYVENQRLWWIVLHALDLLKFIYMYVKLLLKSVFFTKTFFNDVEISVFCYPTIMPHALSSMKNFIINL